MHIEPEELMAYLDGELPMDRAGAAATHLERCRDCQGVAADFQNVSRRLMEWQVEPSNVTVAWEPREAPPAPRRWWGGRWKPWVWVLASISVLALLVLSQNRTAYYKPAALPQAEFSSALVASKGRLPSPGVAMDAAITRSPLIVQTTRLTLNTSEFDKARPGLDDILKRHRGYFGQLGASSPMGAPRTLEATLRVPAGELESVIADLKKLGRVESESRTGEEVTQQYVDLEARLSNARNTERRLTDLLRQRTGKLTDVLAVEKEIGRVREEIERMEAERKSLMNRVDFAALNLTVAEDYKAQLRIAPDSTLSRFRNSAIEGYKSMIDGLISLALVVLSYGPSLLLWGGLLFFPLRFLWRKWRTNPR
jgi:hypothetical protein